MSRTVLIVLVFGIILGILGSYVLFEINNRGGLQNVLSGKNANISGTLNINGVIPPDSVLTLYQKQANSQVPFAAFARLESPQDLLSWVFSGALKNESYEIKAILTSSDNQALATSDSIFITAPASDEQLKIEVPSTVGGSAVISGTVGLNGYIPPGSTITVEGKKSNSSTYTIVASKLSAIDNQLITYSTAISGQEYNVRAILYNSSGTQIGISDVLTVVAPAQNETLSINSTATPPVTPSPTPQPNIAVTVAPASGAVISGTINFNGAALPNSRIVIFQRPSGTTNFQVAVNNVSPVNGASWQWNGGVAGSWYDMVAILKQVQINGTDNDISDSPIQTFAAPAANEVFTINSGYSVPAPGGQVSVTCGSISNGTTWSSTFSFPSSTNAQSYWIQVGVTSGGVELMNQTMNASSNVTQQVNANLQNGVTYFARYAYALVPNLPAGSQQYSPFSSISQLRCSQ